MLDLLKFDLTQNELKSLPPLGELRRMITLHCNHNNIEELPNFYGCSALKEVHMANNLIKVQFFFICVKHLSVCV